MKFLVVDAHPVLRERLTAVLRHNFAEAVIHVASDEAQALRIVKRHKTLDVILADFDIPGGYGARLVGNLSRQAGAPIIAMTSSESILDICHALKLGAKGCLPKSASQATMAAVVRFVADGEIYVPPAVLAQIRPSHGARVAPIRDLDGLTPRQMQTLTMLADGKRNAAIADLLHLSEKTVKAHVTAVFRTLGVSNRQEAMDLMKSRLKDQT